MTNKRHYEITPENLLGHELIGLRMEVVKSSDKSREGIKGRVVDETKNLLVIESKQQEKRIPKKDSVFRFMVEGKEVLVQGRKIIARPEDRTKMWMRCRHGRMQ